MSSQPIPRTRFIIALVSALLCLVNLAQAGPPLICHPFEIGQAKSLPWISHSWSLTGSENFDLKHLVRDTLEILGPNIPVLVRMETLRRATLYARKDPVAAQELLTRLHARAISAESSGHPDALLWFDIGYLAESYKQWIGQDKHNPATGVDGYALVKRAIRLRGLDSQMEFAAALITLSGPQEEHRQHARKAIAGAKSDSLLAQNLRTHFTGRQSETMSEMLAEN
jgi:hypothetical protein